MAAPHDTKKPGVVRLWYSTIREFKSGPPRHRALPHLTNGALIVTVVVGSFFVLAAANAIAIIVSYGPHAFFIEGLRITNWKHDMLSNGTSLSFVAKLLEVLTTLVLMGVLVLSADFAAMLIRALAARNPPWVGVLLRLLGGAGLLLFARCIYRQGYPFNHPIPLAALAGGAVLILKAIASASRGSPPQPIGRSDSR